MIDLLQDFEVFLRPIVETAIGLDYMPEEPDSCIAIYEYQGSSGLPQIAGVTRSIQIVARSNKATSARAIAKKAYDALDVEDGIINLTEQRWGKLMLKHTPIKLKVDDKNRVYYVFNLSIITYKD